MPLRWYSWCGLPLRSFRSFTLLIPHVHVHIHQHPHPQSSSHQALGSCTITGILSLIIILMFGFFIGMMSVSKQSKIKCMIIHILFPDVRQRLGKRPHSPETPQPSSISSSHREPMSDVHSRLGIPRQEGKGLYSDTREKKSGQFCAVFCQSTFLLLLEAVMAKGCKQSV